MPIVAPWLPLTSHEIAKVPEAPGVYELATLVRTVLYIGVSGDGSLRKGIASHHGQAANLLRKVKCFRYEVTQQEAQRQAQLLKEYKKCHHGNLPAGNLPKLLAKPLRDQKKQHSSRSV